MSAEPAETVAAEIVDSPMGHEDAKKLDGRIRRLAGASKDHLDQLGALVVDAKAVRIHEALGFKSWTAYLADALQELCSGQGVEMRRELVTYLYDKGMSERAIAAATGASKTTVHRDLESAGSAVHVVHSGPPEADPDAEAPEQSDAEADGTDGGEPVTVGTDDKEYQRKRPKRPKDQGQQEILSKENHAKILAGLVINTGSLSAAATTLNKLIPDDLDASVTPESATTLANRFQRNITTFMRIYRLLKDRAGEEAHP